MLGTFSSKSARHVPCPAIQVLASDLDAGETSRSRGRDDIPAPSKITSSMSGCADTIKPARHDELVAARARKRQSRRLQRVSSAMWVGALFGDEDDLSDRVTLLNLAQRVGRLIQRIHLGDVRLHLSLATSSAISASSARRLPPYNAARERRVFGFS